MFFFNPNNQLNNAVQLGLEELFFSNSTVVKIPTMVDRGREDGGEENTNMYVYFLIIKTKYFNKLSANERVLKPNSYPKHVNF